MSKWHLAPVLDTTQIYEINHLIEHCLCVLKSRLCFYSLHPLWEIFNFYIKQFYSQRKKNNRTLDSSDLKKLSTMDVAYNVYSSRKPNDLFEFLILPVDL